jgi:hypothetical protein
VAVVIAVVITIMVAAVAVAPLPIFFLLLGAALTVFAMFAASLGFPSTVGCVLVRGPAVIVVVINVVDAVVMMLGASCADDWS